MPVGDLPYVGVEQLEVGMYVYIDLKWFQHPFAFNNFKIKDAEQIATIRGLGSSECASILRAATASRARARRNSRRLPSLPTSRY